MKDCKKQKVKLNNNHNKNLDLARELKTLWKMKVTVIRIVTGTLSTVIKRLVQGLEDLEIRGQEETIQITALLILARILRRILETCFHSNSSEKPSANAGVKNPQKSKIIYILKNIRICYFFSICWTQLKWCILL